MIFKTAPLKHSNFLFIFLFLINYSSDFKEREAYLVAEIDLADGYVIFASDIREQEMRALSVKGGVVLYFITVIV